MITNLVIWHLCSYRHIQVGFSATMLDCKTLLKSSRTKVILACFKEMQHFCGVALVELEAWSLTDCISFVVMKEHQITEALTNGAAAEFKNDFRIERLFV